jgi:outer membrane lipoprotein carrier protein
MIARLILIACFFGTLTSAATGQSTEAEQIMQRLRDRFQESGMLSATFRQTLDADYAGSSSSIEGKIFLKDRQYRIETSDQIVVTDGVVTWVYVEEDRQVIVNDYEEDEETFTLGHFLDERSDRYDVSLAPEQPEGYHVVTLSAKTPDTFLERATLWIDAREYIVSRIEVVDVNGAFMRFEMSDVDLEPELDESTFQFQPGEDVEVVDLR